VCTGQMNVSDRGAQCNRAIMLITDGAPDTYEDIFAKYNWPNKDVRSTRCCFFSSSSSVDPSLLLAREKQEIPE